jgi:hypothetical protein
VTPKSELPPLSEPATVLEKGSKIVKIAIVLLALSSPALAETVRYEQSVDAPYGFDGLYWRAATGEISLHRFDGTGLTSAMIHFDGVVAGLDGPMMSLGNGMDWIDAAGVSVSVSIAAPTSPSYLADPIASIIAWGACDCAADGPAYVGGTISIQYEFTAVPEPGTLGLVAFGMLAAFRSRRRMGSVYLEA